MKKSNSRMWHFFWGGTGFDRGFRGAKVILRDDFHSFECPKTLNKTAISKRRQRYENVGKPGKRWENVGKGGTNALPLLTCAYDEYDMFLYVFLKEDFSELVRS